ncbi:MAG: hypothetical protein IT373_21795 [Polyangiaceae bacterium]|nr:hypothetical protein [Polyangiaceae bacterium]
MHAGRNPLAAAWLSPGAMGTVGFVVFVVAWIVLQQWVLPRFGVST